MTVNIAQLPANSEAKALVTFEVRRTEILPPEKTDVFVLPDPKKIPANVKRYLSPSPKIESRDAKIRELAKKIRRRQENRLGARRSHLRLGACPCRLQEQERRGRSSRGSKERLGDRSARRAPRWPRRLRRIHLLFVAIRRAADIPARTVWVYGHVYPEFYLFDDKEQGHWFPCQSIGSKGSAREFGGITQLDMIVQKGDNVRPPRSKERQRLMSERLTGTPMVKGAQPQCRFVREPAPKD